MSVDEKKVNRSRPAGPGRNRLYDEPLLKITVNLPKSQVTALGQQSLMLSDVRGKNVSAMLRLIIESWLRDRTPVEGHVLGGEMIRKSVALPEPMLESLREAGDRERVSATIRSIVQAWMDGRFDVAQL